MTKKSSTITSINLSFEDTKIAFASKDNFQLKKSYWIFAAMNQNWLVNLGTFFIKLFLFLHFPVKKVIKSTIFAQFCGGETIDGCESTIQELEKAYKVDLMDKMNVSYKQGDYVAYKTLTDFKKMAKDKAVSKNTIVFNNLVNSKAEYLEFWEVPASESWHSRFLK